MPCRSSSVAVAAIGQVRCLRASTGPAAVIAAPHFIQKRLPAGFSVPHAGQDMRTPPRVGWCNAEVVLPLRLTHFLETRGDAFSPAHTTSLTAKARACYAQLGRPQRSCAWVDRWL